jgi:glutathione-regulated potassium-efflux system ancillary protein KefC
MDHGLLSIVVVLLGASVVLVPLFQRLGLGSVMGYLTAGILVGPFVFGFITEVDDILHFSEIGVVLFLFLIGLEVEIKKLVALKSLIFGLGGLQLFGTAAVISGLLLIFGLPFPGAWVAGVAFGLSSTAIALQILKDKNLMPTLTGESAFSILLFQDLAVIPFLAFLPLMAASPADSGDQRWISALKITAVLVLVIVLGRLLLRHILRLVAQSHLREVFTALSLLVVLGMAWLMTTLDLSMGLGAFLAGVLLADSEYRHAVETDIEPFKGLLLGLFFMSVGMSINFEAILAKPLWILALVVMVVLAKVLVHLILAKFYKIESKQRLFFAVVLSQIGEFAFVVIGAAQGLKILEGSMASGLIAVIAVSMMTTPLLIWAYDQWIAPRMFRKVEGPADKIENENNPVIIAGFGRFGQIIGRLLYANKIKATVLDHEPTQIELLRKFGFKVYYGDATRSDLLHSAGAESAKILVVAVDDVEDNLKVIETAQSHFPHLKIFARARNMQHYYLLIDKKVHVIEREMFEGSLKLGTEVLRELGWPAYQSVNAGHRFRDHNLKTIYDLHPRRSNEADLVSKAKQSRDDLEKMFEQDLEKRNQATDGWV